MSALTTKLKKYFGVQDMTVGSPLKCLVQFSIPLLIGNVAQQLYSTVDSIVVGQYIGDTALAAVGTAAPIMNLLLVLYMGIATGASIMASQFFGAKDRATLSRVVGSTLFLIAVSGLVMSFVGVFASPALIQLVNPPAEVAEGATIYLQIIFAGLLATSAYNILSGVMRGMGDSMYPLIYLIVACLLNTILDVVFVAYFRMGIAGVAWATIIAQTVSAILCLVRIFRMKETIGLNRETLKPDGKLILQLCKLGLPAGVTQVIFSLSMVITQNLVNSLGTAVIAANVAVMRVDGFAMMPNFTFGTASTTYAGQNIGAKRMDRVHKGTITLLKLALSVSGVLVACILLFGYNLINLFTTTPEVIEIGTRGLRWLALGYLVFAATQVLQGVMRAAGETAIPMWLGIINTVAIRLPLAYLLVGMTKSAEFPNGSPDALFASLLITWIIGAVLTVIVYFKGRWHKRMIEKATPAPEFDV